MNRPSCIGNDSLWQVLFQQDEESRIHSCDYELDVIE